MSAIPRYSQEQMRALASKYIWLKTPEEASALPERVIAQVMNIGDYDDVQMLVKLVGDEVLREVLVSSEAGQFNERSWSYWHYRLGLAKVDEVPPLPVRRFEAAASAELIQAFAETRYDVHHEAPFTMHIGRPCPELKALMAEHNALSAAFITTWNPFSQNLPPDGQSKFPHPWPPQIPPPVATPNSPRQRSHIMTFQAGWPSEQPPP